MWSNESNSQIEKGKHITVTHDSVIGPGLPFVVCMFKIGSNKINKIPSFHLHFLFYKWIKNQWEWNGYG